MQELLSKWFPNLVEKLPEFYKSIGETLEMLGRSGITILILGMLFGVILSITKKGAILENKVVYETLDKIINFFRSIPFIILLAGLIPLTRIISGTAIGVDGAIVPLIFGTTPFFARQIESALAQLDSGLIEAAQSMGNGPIEIIFRVILKESIPHIIRAITITVINLIGLTAMAGAVGAGGLGDFAIRFGYQRNQTDITYACVIVLVILVSVFQTVGNVMAKKTTH